MALFVICDSNAYRLAHSLENGVARFPPQRPEPSAVRDEPTLISAPHRPAFRQIENQPVGWLACRFQSGLSELRIEIMFRSAAML